jgi:predicted RNA-binding protein YlxR (DUF448 family)
MKTLFKWFLTASLVSIGATVLAQIPPTQHSNDISYISGGVGEEEAAAILAEAKQWPVLLELSQIENGRGVWIFGVKIKISNSKKQTIFDAQADGPYMLINLDAGDYLIEASYQGVEQKSSLNVKADSSQKISLFWK